MHIAITGGTGYLGAHTVRRLVEAGHRIRLLVAPGCADDAVVGHLCALGEVDIVDGDIRATSTVTRLLAGCDAVIHAAGVVGTDRRREALMWEINAHATEAFEKKRSDAARKSIWATGCKSWYLDKHGVPASWPWTPSRFFEEMNRPKLEFYDLVA